MPLVEVAKPKSRSTGLKPAFKIVRVERWLNVAKPKSRSTGLKHFEGIAIATRPCGGRKA